MAERKFILHFKMAPGDVSMLSALVRDISLTYGDRYAVDVRTNFDAIWRHNPHITAIDSKDPAAEVIKMDYGEAKVKNKTTRTGGIQRAGREKIHFVTEFYRFFQEKTRIRVPCLYPHADLHLSDEEKENPRISGRYWIIVPGGKTDMTNKFWSQMRYQEVVDKLRPYGLNFVQEGAVKKLCVHPPLDNVLNVVGLTSVRDLIVNIYHAEGVICGVTFQMHVAGAFHRPCVILGAGREEPWWEEYSNEWNAFGSDCAPVKVPHRYLHTIGLLDCCKTKGCWRQRVQKLNDRSKHDNSLCKLPVPAEGGQVVPKCQDMITVDHVLESVMWYYEEGYLPPPSWPVEDRNRWRKEGVPRAIRSKPSEGALQPNT